MVVRSDHLETEVKFHLPDTDPILRRLRDLKADAGPRQFETNLRFDNPANDMARHDQLLRLRQDHGCRLTVKRKPEGEDDRQCKVFHELEVAVSDHDTMAAILNALGYKRVQRYEKWRQTFFWQGVEICIDNMPYGDCLEIEGEVEDIRSAAARLGLPWGERILTNYLAIFERLRQAHALPFNDVTFDNFRGYPLDILPLIAPLQAADD